MANNNYSNIYLIDKCSALVIVNLSCNMPMTAGSESDIRFARVVNIVGAVINNVAFLFLMR